MTLLGSSTASVPSVRAIPGGKAGGSSAMKIFVISLKDAGQNRARIAEQMARCGLDYEIVDAVDGRTLDVAEQRRHCDPTAVDKNCGRPLSAPEIGCALSHRALYARIVSQGLPGAICLEDDAVIGPHFVALHRYLTAYAATLALRNMAVLLGPGARNAALHMRYLLFSCRGVLRVGDGVRLRQQSRLGRMHGDLWGAYAYFVTRRAARSMLVTERLVSAADDWNLWRNPPYGLDVYLSDPPVVFQPERHGSTIEASRAAAIARGPWWPRVRNRVSVLFFKGVARQVIRFVLRPAVAVACRLWPEH